MSQRHDDPRIQQQRTLIAHTAARLMAEEGIADTDLARRKAARQLGLAKPLEMPDSDEVENELRAYRRLFQDAEHEAELTLLRRKAVEIMVILQPFRPYLSGPVLDGSAGRYAEIDIQLFVDSSKEVEIFLLNRQIEYQHSEPRSERAEAVLTFYIDDTPCNLIIYPMQDERIAFKTRNGKSRPHARLEAVRKLLVDGPGPEESSE